MNSIVKYFLIFLAVLFVIFGFFGTDRDRSADNTKKLVIWHWMTDRDSTLRSLIDRYNQERREFIKLELYAPSDVYSQKIRIAAQSGTLPASYGILSGISDISTFITNDYIVNLNDAMQKDNYRWQHVFREESLKSNFFKPGNFYNVPPGIYGVPLDMMTIQMVYNKDILASVGWNRPPATWREFLEVGKEINDKTDKHVFVSGFSELWLINVFIYVYAAHIMGEKKLLQTISREVSYNDPQWREVFSLFLDLRASNLFMSGIVTMGNKKAEEHFSRGRVAFAMNGSWCVNVYSHLNPDLKYGFMSFPKVYSDNPMKLYGGAGSSLFINYELSQNQKARMIRFFQWFTEKDIQRELSQKTNNISSRKDVRFSGNLGTFLEGIEGIIHPSVLGRQELPTIEEVIGKGIQSILIDEIDMTDFISNLVDRTENMHR